MGCGSCTSKETALARALICHSCVFALRKGGQAVSCTVGGLPVIGHVQGAPCRKNKHPDGDGVVRWIGLRWYGVPRPIVWWLSIRWPALRAASLGCGCLKGPKDLWRRIRGAEA